MVLFLYTFIQQIPLTNTHRYIHIYRVINIDLMSIFIQTFILWMKRIFGSATFIWNLERFFFFFCIKVWRERSTGGQLQWLFHCNAHASTKLFFFGSSIKKKIIIKSNCFYIKAIKHRHRVPVCLSQEMVIVFYLTAI